MSFRTVQVGKIGSLFFVFKNFANFMKTHFTPAFFIEDDRRFPVFVNIEFKWECQKNCQLSPNQTNIIAYNHIILF